MNPMYSGIVLFDHTTDTTLQPLLVQKVVTAVGLLPRLALCQLVARSLVRVSGTETAGSAMASLPSPRGGVEGLRRDHGRAGGQDGTRSEETVDEFIRVATNTPTEGDQARGDQGAPSGHQERPDGLRDEWQEAWERRRSSQAPGPGQGEWQDRQWGEGHRQWDWGDQWGWREDWWSAASRGKDYADPPAWAGWPNYRLWKRSIQRWDQSTDVSVNRRAERIFKTMDWDLQARFEHLGDDVITGHGYLTAVLNILDVLAGEKQASEMRRVVRRALFEGGRKNEESISQFALRRDQDFSMAEKYLQIPDNLKGIMLEEHANLSKQAMLNLRTLTGGSSDYHAVSQALKVLDLEEEHVSSKGKGGNFLAFDDAGSSENVDEDEVSLLATQDQEDILVETEKMELDEKVAVEVFVALEKEKRFWKENKKLKMAQRKDRRHFSDRTMRPYGAGRPKESEASMSTQSRRSRGAATVEIVDTGRRTARSHTDPRLIGWSRRSTPRAVPDEEQEDHRLLSF